MRTYLVLWASQMFSGLGSAMTAYALVIWSYTQEGSALRTALLMVSSYAPYVVLSIFAGALSDRWDKKKTMLICDVLAVFIRIPKGEEESTKKEGLLETAGEGVGFLKKERGILALILFLAAINLVASV